MKADYRINEGSSLGSSSFKELFIQAINRGEIDSSIESLLESFNNKELDFAKHLDTEQLNAMLLHCESAENKMMCLTMFSKLSSVFTHVNGLRNDFCFDLLFNLIYKATQNQQINPSQIVDFFILLGNIAIEFPEKFTHFATADLLLSLCSIKLDDLEGLETKAWFLSVLSLIPEPEDGIHRIILESLFELVQNPIDSVVRKALKGIINIADEQNGTQLIIDNITKFYDLMTSDDPKVRMRSSQLILKMMDRADLDQNQITEATKECLSFDSSEAFGVCLEIVKKLPPGDIIDKEFIIKASEKARKARVSLARFLGSRDLDFLRDLGLTSNELVQALTPALESADDSALSCIKILYLFVDTSDEIDTEILNELVESDNEELSKAAELLLSRIQE